MKNPITEVFDALGGIEAMTRWGKSHKAAFYTLFSRSTAATSPEVQHAEPPDPIATQAAIENAFMQTFAGHQRQKELGVDARGYSIVDDAVSGVPNADVAHGDIRHTDNGMQKVAAPQALLEQHKSNPNVDSVPTRSSKPKPAHVESVSGANAAAALGYGDSAQPDYHSVNWSQTRYWPT
jgi:hypothetical protein